MSDFQKRVERFEDDKSKDWILPPVEKAGKDRREKEEFLSADQKEERSRAALFAMLALYCKKFLALFSSQEKMRAALVDLKQVADDLQNLQQLVQKLSLEDASRKPEFTRQFSELWQKLADDLERVEAFEGEKPLLGLKIKAVIEKISSYPLFVDHPLGYYLAEHAGEEWMPVPFMEILAQLHKDHQEKQSRSEISLWLNLIQDALVSLNVKPDLI